MDLPKRPQLWMHRTRIFWFGLTGFLLLVAAWLGSSFLVASFGYSEVVSKRFSQIGFESGCLVIRSVGESWRVAGFDASWHRMNLGLRFWPEEWLLRPTKGAPHLPYQLALPLWLFIPPWLAGWLWWMAQKDRREAAYFSGITTPAEK